MFDERIRELRHSLGINQVEFGKRLNVTKQCISNWENNNIMPSIDMLIRISKTFSVSADYLLGLENRQTLDVSGLSAETDPAPASSHQRFETQLKKRPRNAMVPQAFCLIWFPAVLPPFAPARSPP